MQQRDMSALDDLNRRCEELRARLLVANGTQSDADAIESHHSEPQDEPADINSSQSDAAERPRKRT